MSYLMENGYLPAAAPSPRISSGVLKWYEGDTFDLQVQIELTDESGAALVIQPEHTVEFVFRNRKREVVYSVIHTDLADNCVVLRFSEEVSDLFPKGEYTYDVFYKGSERKTLAHRAPVTVE